MTTIPYDIEATFLPKRRETLRPEAAPFIGERMRFRYAWVVTEDDGGPYVGQRAYHPVDREFGWAPEEDLDEIETIRFVEYDD